MEKLTVADPTLFDLQAVQSVPLSPYVPRQQVSKGSFLDTSHSCACKPAGYERHTTNIECVSSQVKPYTNRHLANLPVS